jgi:eukaryotic-like serine/threonine-protein kinase
VAHPELEPRNGPVDVANGAGQAVSGAYRASARVAVEARMHPLTLRFDGRLEEEFADEYYERTLAQVRLALVLGGFLYAVFGILDMWMAPDHRRELWFIRFAVVEPAMLGCLAFSYSRQFRRVRELAVSATVLIAALGIVAMTAIIPPPGSYLYYAGLILAIVYTFTLVRLAVPHAFALSVVIVLAYVGVALRVIETPAELLVNNLFFLVSSAIIAGSSNYLIERYARTNFLQRRVIELRTQELEEKNAQLVARNQALAESRAATARSARRSELIFSALSEALPGTVLDDKYRVEEKIGSGSFGTVYRGEHILLHHPVAIKVFRPTVGHGALESLDRFRLEGISACRIQHPNAVTVLDFDVSAGSLAYLVMELLQGRSLSDELRADKQLAPRRCARISAAVCDVLAQAHAAGIVHRDIKPSNVFLHRNKDEERVKVIDFGIAKLTDDVREPGLRPATTGTGIFVGTPAYMAPERLGSDPYDGRADVYSLGVMMFQMLCGQLPHQIPRGGGYWSATMMNALGREPELADDDASVPRELEAIVIRALAKDPEQRPTAAELGEELKRYLDHEALVGAT